MVCTKTQSAALPGRPRATLGPTLQAAMHKRQKHVQSPLLSCNDPCSVVHTGLNEAGKYAGAMPKHLARTAEHEQAAYTAI